MPEQTQDNVVPGAVTPPRPPVPDLGFFAGRAVRAAAGRRPAAARPRSVSLSGSRRRTGSVPAMSTFGRRVAAPSAVAPVAAPPPRPTGSGAGWKVAAGGSCRPGRWCALVVGGRFGWQQFVADPVGTPDTSTGMPNGWATPPTTEHQRTPKDGRDRRARQAARRKVGVLQRRARATGYLRLRRAGLARVTASERR